MGEDKPEQALAVPDAKMPATTEQNMIVALQTMAADPNTDVAKMEGLVELQFKMMDRQAKIDFDNALAEVQADMPRITAKGQIKNKQGQAVASYLKYEDIDAVIRPRLQAQGFSLIHSRKDENGKMVIKTTLKHRSGHEVSVQIPLPYDQPNNLKNAVQAAVSTASYGKRTNVCSLLNIVAEGEDDDGMKAVHVSISDEQAAELKGMIEKLHNEGTPIDHDKFLEYVGAASVDEISVDNFQKAHNALRQKMKG